MKKTKILSLLLCLSLLCALLVPGTAAYADDADSGMNISKTAELNSDGFYTITLEAFATGSKVTQVVQKDVPTDIVLVLDQSGSMENDIGTVAFEEYKNEYYYGWTDYHTRNRDYYDYRHNGGSANLWHKLEDNTYVSVSVTKTPGYTALGTLVNYKTDWWNDVTTDCYYYYSQNLYEKVEGEYKKVNLTYAGNWREGYTFTYTFSDGTFVSSKGLGTTPDLSTHAPLYTLDESKDTYTYTYTDANNATQTIGTSTGADTVFSPTLYKRVTRANGGGSKLAALKSAASTFVNAVAAKAAGPDGQPGTTDDINHRIAVVGFASQSGNGNNTELLSISGGNSGSVGVAYNSITSQNLKDVVQSMDTSTGQAMVNNAINALATNGATRIDLGLDMAKRILEANPVGADEKRNRVVIVFTDGAPTAQNGFQLNVADSAISNASAIKNSGATVYSVGVFSGADATSAGSRPAQDYYDDGWGSNYTGAQMAAACNWFMQSVSSNNGSVRSPSYYLSASDAASLSSIFQQISSNIESGGATTTLDEKSEIRDIIAPAFSVPANTTDVKLYTAESSGSITSWGERQTFNGTVKIENDTVTASGFSFKDNWCGTETMDGEESFHNGKKLIIEFTVKLKDGFLGGNDVPTNGKAGVYVDATAKDPIMEFESPTVNIPIPDVTVTAQDKNVYLLGNVTADQLKSGAAVTVGNASLDLTKDNYGLESWQTAYVNIDVKVKDANGAEIPTAGLSSLTNDTTYTIEVTVSPKTDGSVTTQGASATAKSGSGKGNINVFKPTLTFQDSDVYYGGDAPTDYSGSKVSEKWTHGTTDSGAAIMIGAAPELACAYTPEAGRIVDGKISAKTDIAVDVAVKIGETDVTGSTTFIHTKCSGNGSCTDPANGKFWLHVRTCQLTITKTGGADDESYVFTVNKDGAAYSQVSIYGNGSQTIYELPVGEYTIAEDEGWSWRYTPSYSGGATLSAATPEGTITCTNEQKNGQWLNGFSTIARNSFVGIS